MPHRRSDRPLRITSAPTNKADEIASRQRRYLFSMAIRTACVIGAVAVGPGWFRWVLIAGAVLLPYVAVVIANAANQRDDGFRPETPNHQHRELGGTR
ncbi:MAG: DUF3099 domain-containing protein [Nocardioides sp.]